MNITEITVNHMHEPLGFELKDLRVEFAAQTDASAGDVSRKIVVTAQDATVYETQWEPYRDNVFDIPAQLEPRTRYDVCVSLKAGTEETQGSTWFETGKMDEPFAAQWIGNADKDLQNTLLKKDFSLHGAVESARLYMTGLGLYEVYANNKKVGKEYLAPGTTAYNKLVQVQTYDVTQPLSQEDNELLISLGDGWYKGNYGFDSGQENIYGDRHMAIAELHIRYVDGSQSTIATDDTWRTTQGRITKSAIYYGEDLDDTARITDWRQAVVCERDKSVLHDRLSLPITLDEYLPVAKIITTPAGETVLDFGQNQAGWPEFLNREPKGTKITLEMGEILQNGNFYRDNLREARAAFTYVSNGERQWVRPHFTYYGYRYVRVTGNTRPIEAKDFRAAVMHSHMKTTGGIETDQPKVNRLLQNILWGQKSNFMDVPTDCPQRDERLGWSGDADIFSSTAALNMDVYAFFKKYAKDMAIEQRRHDGMLTMYAPAMGNEEGGAAVWGDAATVIPWNMYQATKDPAILRQNYSCMKAWVDWIGRTTKTKNLWTGAFQFGDWLAMDGENPGMPTGKTEEDFIASVYYGYSSSIVARAAAVLGKQDDSAAYADQAERIRQAITAEYVTPNGRLALDTQTAYAMALYFNLVPENQKQHILKDLVTRLDKDGNHLKTGFVGTPILCQALSDNGRHDLAMQIFLNEDLPSWLYAVNLGATTVWERWNSVLPDGSMNPEGMNSLNHYSIGAIMEWVYRYVLGLQRQGAGYQYVTLAPLFDYRLKHVKGHYTSSFGDLKVEYQLETDEDHTISLHLDVPFGQEVALKLPRSTGRQVMLNGTSVEADGITLTNGSYSLQYRPTQSYIEYYKLDMPVASVMADDELVQQLGKASHVFDFFKDAGNLKNFGAMSLPKLNTMLPFINVSADEMERIKSVMETTPLASERRFLNARGTI